MSVTYPLDRFLKKITKLDAKSLKDSKNRKIVHYNSKDGAKMNIPKFSFKDWETYRLSLNESVDYKTKCIVHDFSSDQSIELNIRYQLCLEKGNGTIEDNCLNVVTNLSALNHPAEALNKLISGWVKECVDKINEKDNFVYMYFSKQHYKYLNEYIHLEARKIGLNLKTVITVEHEDNLTVYEIKTEKFPIYTKDSSEEQNLSFILLLDVDDENKINAILKYNHLHELKDKIKGKIKAFFKANVSLHEYIFKIKELSDKIQKDRKLIDFLKNEGRTIESLVLVSDKTIPEDKRSKVFEHTSKCRIKGYDEKIDVKHLLLIELTDLGIYQSCGIKNLETWLQETLDNNTQNELFEKTYSEILLDFEIENSDSIIAIKIKNNVEKLIQGIGYKVTQIITLPDLQPIQFIRNGFSFERAGSFPTNKALINVNLSFYFSGKIKSLKEKGIRDLLHPTTDIEDEIWKMAMQRCKEVMHLIDPERFYFRFETEDENEKISVKDKLVKEIKHALETNFNLAIDQIIPKQEETEISKRFANLIGHNPYTIDIAVNSLIEDTGVQDINFSISFQVLNVDSNGFPSFASKTYNSLKDEIDDLKLAVGRNISVIFGLLRQKELQYKDLDSYKDILEAQKYVIDKVRESFGLIIRFESTMRELTEIEKALKIANVKTLINKIELSASIEEQSDLSKSEQLSQLLEIQGKFLKGNWDEDDEDYKNIINSIEKIRKEFSLRQSDDQIEKFKSVKEKEKTNMSKLGKIITGDNTKSVKQIEENNDENKK